MINHEYNHNNQFSSPFEEYNLVHNNSLDFADALCEALGVGRLPRQGAAPACSKGPSDIRGLEPSNFGPQAVDDYKLLMVSIG